jgi:nucleoside-diphosphate-sugar epimerase
MPPIPAIPVLITGSSGLIGSAAWQRLSESPDRYRLTGFDVRSDPDRARATMIGNVADFAAVARAVAGQHTVVHLGANGGPGDLWDRIRESNLIGTYNVFEAARQAGVRRIVFASTGQVTWNWEQEPPLSQVLGGTYGGEPGSYDRIDHTWPVRPSGIYAASKVWGEALGRYYSDIHGISVVVIRFSAVNRPDTPLNPTPAINPGDAQDGVGRSFSIWTSQADAAQLVRRAIDAPASLKFDVFYSGSANKWGVRDISHAQKVLGYRPESSAEDFRRVP